MLVDDNELDNFINKKLIENESFGSNIAVHQSAQSALNYLRNNAASADMLPSVIFLDIMMPEMDGFGFLDEFDKLPDTAKTTCRIVMLSTSDSFKDLNRANQNKYVKRFRNKPLSAQILNALNL